MKPLDRLFTPRSVAVLGVSRNPAKLGFRLLQNVKEGGYEGAIHAVNPAGEAILGLETVPRIDLLPDGVDLALVSLPAPAVADAITALGARRVGAAVILSSGFGEVDDDGRATQVALAASARSARLRLVGPNCMGVYSSPARLNGTYFWDLPRVAGGISVVSQSGAYGGLIFRHLGSRGLGVARFLSIGNQVDVDIAEVIEYLADDPATTLIACFIEALRDGVRFVAAARRAAATTPVVVLKGGRSSAGGRAASSHTGSLAGSDDLYRAAFDRANVVLTEETEEFFDAIEALTIVGARRAETPDAAIITVSGGPSVVATDAAERAGLRVPALSVPVRTSLRALLPPFAAVGNPVDLTPQVEPARIARAVRVVLEQSDIAGAIAIDVGLDVPEFAEGVIAAASATDKPVVAFVADAPMIAERFKQARIPVLPSPERAVRAWGALWRARPRSGPISVDTSTLPEDVAHAIATTTGPLSWELARRALETYGVRFCRETVARTVDDTVRAAETLRYPVVVKANTPGLTHKSEAGGVRLDVRDAAGVRDACEALRQATGATSFLVQERIGPGVELLVGARRDPVFGPVVALGAGGILTEVFRDVSFRLAPLEEGEIEAMLGEGVRPRLLAGPRGLPPVERSAVVAPLRALSNLIVAEPRILEIDVNPLIAAGRDVIAVDALVIVGDAT